MSCPFIVFMQTSILKCPFVYQHNELSVLRRRSAIWVDNRCPLMCEVRGKRWSKYIIIIIFGELRNPMEQRQYLKQIHNNVIYKVISEDAMFNILEHQLLAPLQYLSTSYDMGIKPCILQRWIEATIYNNDESSKIQKLCT